MGSRSTRGTGTLTFRCAIGKPVGIGLETRLGEVFKVRSAGFMLGATDALSWRAGVACESGVRCGVNDATRTVGRIFR